MRSALRTEESKARAVSRSVADVGENAGALGQCRAVVVSCIDYRFVEPLRHFLADHRLTGTVDLIAWPGGAAALTTPDRDALVDAIGLAFDLHDPAEILLVAHHDCGRLGGSVCFPGRQAEIATLDTALAMAEEIVADRFPANAGPTRPPRPRRPPRHRQGPPARSRGRLASTSSTRSPAAGSGSPGCP